MTFLPLIMAQNKDMAQTAMLRQSEIGEVPEEEIVVHVWLFSNADED